MADKKRPSKNAIRVARYAEKMRSMGRSKVSIWLTPDEKILMLCSIKEQKISSSSSAADAITSKLQSILKIVETNNRGVIKRIDENRELLELLRDKNSEFLEKFPWAVDLIRSQDEFLVELSIACNISDRHKKKSFPRIWPEISP